MLNDSFSCRSTFFCILRDKNGYTIINSTGNYYTEAQTREQTRTDIIVDYLGKQYVIELKSGEVMSTTKEAKNNWLNI